MKLTGISRNHVLAIGVAALACLSNTEALAYEPTFQWVRQVGGAGREYGTEVAVDSEGRTHVVGDFSSTNLVIGNTTLTNGGLFIARYDLTGNAIWAKQIHTTFDRLWKGSDFDYRIAADDLGNTFISMWLQSNESITFDDVTLTNGSPPNEDLILAKYDASGSLAWARKTGTDGTQNSIRSLTVAADSTGNCYVAGGYFDAPSLGLTNVSNDVGAFVAKFDSDGDLIWAQSLTSSNIVARDQFLALDNSGGYFVAGYFWRPSITFGNFTLTNRGGVDIFIVRYDSTGSPLWAKSISGIDNNSIYVGVHGFGVDFAGNSYIHLYAEDTISFDNLVITNGGFCFAKYGPAGNVLWCRTSATADASVLRSTTDAAGNSYVLGTFYDSAAFDGITLTNHNNPEYPNFAYPDNFLAKFDSDGRVHWAKQFGGTDIGPDHTRKGSVAVDSAGNCRVTGFIYVPDSTFDGFLLSPVGEDEDFFVARLDADPPRLDITHSGNIAVLSWPTNQPGFTLETSTNLLSNEAWSLVLDPVTTAGTRYFVTNSLSANNRFFRLRK